ncbi:glucose-1-phosphate cytidylyltransferase [Jiangella mangrovi]|uniref:Glucose-1-phosphate cytidylyltransferase n=1 Tax=Jiangella mangrovi TaxID=1524084 RepID=A0A7W9LJN5_9ACTN|nr:glucose-1-phosphate cytidylyltransferase [Jiangella mangrovi]
MKTAILAGGLGSRLAEETVVRPKPMVEIGERPILWHIMRHYLHYGHDEFVIACGYKGEVIKRWMLDYATLSADVTVRPRRGEVTVHRSDVSEDWAVDVVDTGQTTNTGGRIKRLAPWVGTDTFMLTWGDGVSDVDLDALLAFHRSHGRIATLTAVRPPARYGHIVTDGDQIVEFSEKPQIGEGWINGAFFVLEPAVFDYIEGDDTQFEKEPLEQLAKDGQLMAYHHHGFWQCMDTVREKHILEELWRSGNAPWKIWE